MTAPRIAVAPEWAPGWLAEAVAAGGGVVVAPPEAEGLVWAEGGTPEELADLLRDAPGIRWVQLPMAGIERFAALVGPGTPGASPDRPARTWTCGKGVYSEPVAELALGLLLAGFRGLHRYARAQRWAEAAGRPLIDARVSILGGGGITEALLRLLAPFRVDATVVRRRAGSPVPGAARVVGRDALGTALAGADAVVVALALTPSTAGIIGAEELHAMPAHAWLVNVGRGGHVVTDDLVDALRREAIGGAALDVTDPEPLPPDHPLWSLPNCLVTPHVAGNTAAALRLLAPRVTENVRRFATGAPLVGRVDPLAGY